MDCRQQEDVAPTIASQLGLPLPDTEGVCMGELFITPPAGCAGFPVQRSEPRVAAGGGNLHVVWTERSTTTGDRAV